MALLGLAKALNVENVAQLNDQALAQEEEDYSRYPGQTDPHMIQVPHDKPLSQLGASLNSKITAQRDTVNKSIENVKKLNARAEQAIKDAKKVDLDLKNAILKHKESKQEALDAQKDMEAAKRKAEEQRAADAQALKMKQMAVVVTQNSARMIQNAKDTISHAQRAHDEVEGHITKYEHMLQDVITAANKLTIGTKIG